MDIFDFNNQRMTAVESNAFHRSPNVRVIWLSGNEVKSFPIFPDSTTLEELDLNDNKIVDLDLSAKGSKGPLPVQDKLRSLLLKNNQLTRIDPILFCACFASLVDLDLSGNQIKALRDGDFAKCSALADLNLSRNVIQTIGSQVFTGGGGKSLRSLDLTENKLESLPNTLAAQLPGLMQLLLSNNQISSIASGAFKGFQRLSEINLAGNRLVSIDASAFAGLEDTLLRLDLSNNAITSIASDTFKNFKNLKHISLEGNPATASLPETTDWRKLYGGGA